MTWLVVGLICIVAIYALDIKGTGYLNMGIAARAAYDAEVAAKKAEEEARAKAEKQKEKGIRPRTGSELRNRYPLCVIFSLFVLVLKITYRSLAMIHFRDSFDIQFQMASKVPVQFACPHIKPGGVCEGSSQYGASFGAKMKDTVPLHKTWPFPDDTTC